MRCGFLLIVLCSVWVLPLVALPCDEASQRIVAYHVERMVEISDENGISLDGMEDFLALYEKNTYAISRGDCRLFADVYERFLTLEASLNEQLFDKGKPTTISLDEEKLGIRTEGSWKERRKKIDLALLSQEEVKNRERVVQNSVSSPSSHVTTETTHSTSPLPPTKEEEFGGVFLLFIVVAAIILVAYALWEQKSEEKIPARVAQQLAQLEEGETRGHGGVPYGGVRFEKFLATIKSDREEEKLQSSEEAQQFHRFIDEQIQWNRAEGLFPRAIRKRREDVSKEKEASSFQEFMSTITQEKMGIKPADTHAVSGERSSVQKKTEHEENQKEKREHITRKRKYKHKEE